MTKHRKTFDQDHLRNVTHIVLGGERLPVTRTLGSDRVLVLVPTDYKPPQGVEVHLSHSMRLAAHPNMVMMTVNAGDVGLVRNGGAK